MKVRVVTDEVYPLYFLTPHRKGDKVSIELPKRTVARINRISKEFLECQDFIEDKLEAKVVDWRLEHE
jgi:hypothetical protein